MNNLVYETCPTGLPRSVIEKLAPFLVAKQPSINFFGNPCVPLGLFSDDGVPQSFEWTDFSIGLIKKHSKGLCLSVFNLAQTDTLIPQGIRLHKCPVECEISIGTVFELRNNFVSLPVVASLLIGVPRRFVGVAMPLDIGSTCYLPTMLGGSPQLIQIDYVSSSDDKRWHVRVARVSSIKKGSNLILSSDLPQEIHQFLE